MAVTTTTKFYAQDEWKDLSKIVFTSPNMISPAVAGTRSHVLPGQGALGVWYEDATNMYRIEEDQINTDTHYCNFKATVLTDFNLDAPATYLAVNPDPTYEDIYADYMMRSCGCIYDGYTDETSVLDNAATAVRFEYASEDTLTDIHTDNIVSTVEGDDTHEISDGWKVDIIPGFEECYLDFEFTVPKVLTKMTFNIMEDRFYVTASGRDTGNHVFASIGNFKLEGKFVQDDAWTEIYSGSAPSADKDTVDATVFLSDNTLYYKYIRLTILTANSCNANSYGLRNLKFYANSFSAVDGVDVKSIYDFTDDRVIKVDNVKRDSITVDNCDLKVDSVEGTGTLTAGTSVHAWGIVDKDTPVDLNTQNSIVFQVTNGEAYDCRLTAWDDATHSSTDNLVISGDHCRVSAMAFCSAGTVENPLESFDPKNIIMAPKTNMILKGNVVDGPTNLFYGDFDMSYKYQDGVIGDFLMFKPMLYGIDDTMPYGVYDFVITLKYSYT